MKALKPFQTATLSVTATSSSGTIATHAVTLEFQNAGSFTAFVRWGLGAQTAVTTDYPVLAGQSKVVTCETGNSTVAAICASGETTTLYVTSGEGV